MCSFVLMRPGRMSAASSDSGWFVVMITMRPGESTTPSSTLRRPARSSLSARSKRLPKPPPVPVPVPPTTSKPAAVSAATSLPPAPPPPPEPPESPFLAGSIIHFMSAAIAWSSSVCSSAFFFRDMTTSDDASMSSSRKMTSRNVKRWLTPSSSFVGNTRSNMMSYSSWFVFSFASGTVTMWRFVCCASALTNDVLPVPGGPCRSRPSLFGNPSIENLPRPATKSSINARISFLPEKNSESNVLSSLSLYFL
mmetsp:Transcript_36020/g.110983  ORF Transcript_36020/g.110983 Transcript_36020/m.110983 type:complete len:252 (+) Transcript_36020:510-1265(+)